MKDYGQEYPVMRHCRQYRAVVVALATSAAAIFVFFALLAVGLTLLPAAIDAELQRQIAVVERNLEVKR